MWQRESKAELGKEMNVCENEQKQKLRKYYIILTTLTSFPFIFIFILTLR